MVRVEIGTSPHIKPKGIAFFLCLYINLVFTKGNAEYADALIEPLELSHSDVGVEARLSDTVEASIGPCLSQFVDQAVGPEVQNEPPEVPTYMHIGTSPFPLPFSLMPAQSTLPEFPLGLLDGSSPGYASWTIDRKVPSTSLSPGE